MSSSSSEESESEVDERTSSSSDSSQSESSDSSDGSGGDTKRGVRRKGSASDSDSDSEGDEGQARNGPLAAGAKRKHVSPAEMLKAMLPPGSQPVKVHATGSAAAEYKRIAAPNTELWLIQAPPGFESKDLAGKRIQLGAREPSSELSMVGEMEVAERQRKKKKKKGVSMDVEGADDVPSMRAIQIFDSSTAHGGSALAFCVASPARGSFQIANPISRHLILTESVSVPHTEVASKGSGKVIRQNKGLKLRYTPIGSPSTVKRPHYEYAKVAHAEEGEEGGGKSGGAPLSAGAVDERKKKKKKQDKKQDKKSPKKVADSVLLAKRSRAEAYYDDASADSEDERRERKRRKRAHGGDDKKKKKKKEKEREKEGELKKKKKKKRPSD
eukprot:TRINITY_DN3899_c0_g1_i1.p1 TRINITY_DN3899_c0_g1~~TRINITY_DN3899_c0_g1_i1.p1  ORF type:complete len:385 (-),score=138.81 TRINITY_DN3899_c0_g1_i1:25-1179(-)